MIIRSSKHTTKFSNKRKLQDLDSFIIEYRRVASIIINQIWNNGYKFYNNEKEFNISKNLLELPKYIEYKNFNLQTFLSTRALSSLCTQLTGILKASTEKQRKRIYILDKMKSSKCSKKQRNLLARKLKQNIPQKPNVQNLNPELPSMCGIVLKQNRKGKTYTCKHCCLVIDSDYNAALNHECNIPEIPYSFRNLNLNRKGFYWLETGLFDLNGRSLESLLEEKTNKGYLSYFLVTMEFYLGTVIL